MKKKTIIALISFYIFSIALILFCVFLYINAKDRHPEENWITIASTENEDNTSYNQKLWIGKNSLR